MAGGKAPRISQSEDEETAAGRVAWTEPAKLLRRRRSATLADIGTVVAAIHSATASRRPPGRRF